MPVYNTVQYSVGKVHGVVIIHDGREDPGRIELLVAPSQNRSPCRTRSRVVRNDPEVLLPQ